MRYGYTKGDPHQLLKRGAVQVFSEELAAVHAVRDGDELLTDEMTPLFKSLVDEHGFRVLKADKIPFGLTWDEENSAEYLKAHGYSAAEVAKALHLDEDAVAVSKAFAPEVVEKALVKPVAKKADTSNPYHAARAAIEESRESLRKAVIAKIAPDTDTTARDAEAKLEKAAAEIRKIEPRLTREQALSKAYSQNPELMKDLI